MDKKSGSRSGMNNPDHVSESLETMFWVKMLKFFDADPEWKNLNLGSGMEKFQIWDKHPGSATLSHIVFYFHLYHMYINSSIMGLEPGVRNVFFLEIL
jgi:hypothetical protein